MESTNKSEEQKSDVFSDVDTGITAQIKKKPTRSEVLDGRKDYKRQLRVLETISKAEGKPQEELISSEPTRLLFVVLGGSGPNVSIDQIKSVFVPFGNVETVDFSASHSSLYQVVFQTTEEASNASKQLKGMESDSIKRKLFIEYAKNPLVSISKKGKAKKNAKAPGPNNAVTLEDSSQVIVPGLFVFQNFITEEEEQELINEIDKYEWTELKYRRVQHYGYEFDYLTNNVDKSKKMGSNYTPSTELIIKPKLEKITAETHTSMPDQVTINEYEPGQGIPPHIDTHSAFEDGIMSLSLLADIVMDFKHPDGPHKSFSLPRRSLLVLTGEARYLWTHGITPRKTDYVNSLPKERERRVSLTFRKILHVPCKCQYAPQCDSQMETSKVPDSLTHVEKQYVQDVYNQIASHFSHTRYKPWPKIEAVLNSLPAGSLVADVGCGNGKYLGVNQNIFKLGSDQSTKLIEICRERNFECMVCDTMHLPFRKNAFDFAISIAVIHHLSTPQHRLRALEQLVSILKVGGRVLVYVWAMEQDERVFQSQDLFVPWHMESCFTEGKTEPEAQPNQTKDESGKLVFQRYYHVFKQNELEQLVTQIPNVVIDESFYDRTNWCVIARKTH